MLEWFNALAWFPKVFWMIAIIASFIFIITIIMSFAGGDTDDFGDVDADIDGDTGIGFQFITFKNLVGFFTIFGWSGIACIDAGLSQTLTIIIAIACGMVMMAIMAAMFYSMRKLSDSGTLDYNNAINQIGEVYLTVGANALK